MWLLADELPSWLLAGGTVMLLSITATITGIFVKATLQVPGQLDRAHDASNTILQNVISDLREDVDAADRRAKEAETRCEAERAKRLAERAKYERILGEMERKHLAELEHLRNGRPSMEPPATS